MDIASLGIKVDSSDVATASTDLDKLTTAGTSAEGAAKRSGDAWSKSFSAMAGDTQQIVRELQALNAKQDATAKLMVSVGTAVTGAATSFSSAAVSISSYQEKLDALAGANQKNRESTRKSNEETRKQTDDLASLLGKIDPTVAALNRLDELESKLGRQKKLGALDPETFAQYQAKIDQSRAALGRFDDSLTRTGNTTKQTAAALRGVPAQFTDIFTSLQGGQAPLTVLLQQGGQLKDMFGGIGPAAQAMGGYVAGLVNPFTVAAAAAAVLGLAYYKGTKETTEFQNALILTGNAAGTTAPRLAEMARQVSATVGTTGAAANVLSQLASSGKVASGAFVEITKAALAMEEATGKAASETVAEFVKIGKEPVAAAKELNDQYNFLTAGIYAQIVALKEQGRETEAAKLLTTTYASAVQERTAQVKANLGSIERAWAAIGLETRKTIDAAFNVGRAEDSAKKIAELQQKIAAARSALNADPDDIDNEKKLRDSQLELNFLTQQRDTEAAIAKAQSNYDEDQRKSQAALDVLHTGYLAGLSKEEKKKREIAELDRKRTDALRGDGVDQAQINKEYDVAVKGINDKYKPDKPKAAGAVDLSSFNNAKLAMAALVGDYKNSEKELEAEQKRGTISQAEYFTQRSVLIAAEKEQVTQAYQAEIAALEAVRSKSTTTGAQRVDIDQKIATARADMVKAQKDADSEQKVLAANEAARLEQQTKASQAYIDQLELQRAALDRSGSRAAAALGLGERQQGLQSSLDGVAEQYIQERGKLLDRRKTAPDKYSQQDYEKDLASLKTAEDAYRATVVGNYDKMTEAQSDWRSGATSAFATYLESAQDVSSMTKSLFTNTFTGLEDVVANFATTGKASFSDFADAVIGDMARIATRQAAAGLLSTGASAFSSLFGSSATTTPGSSIGDYTSAAFQAAVGGRATGGSVAPSSLYQVNENGPELYNQGGKSYLMTGANGGSVTPLTTGAGAASAAGSSGGGIQVSIAIASDGSTDVSSNQTGLQQFGNEVGKLVEQKYKELEARSLGAQGNIRKAINGRA
jgi:lambda family phage tail tape measure protein